MAPADPSARARRTAAARQTATARRAGALLLAACCALSAACSPFGSADDEAAAPPLSTAAPAAGQTLVAGTGPKPSPPAPVPAATVTQDTTSFVTVTQPAPPAKTVTKGTDGGEACTDLVSRSVVGVGVAAVASRGSVQLSWHSRKGASLEGWRVAAARQDLVSGAQPPLVWKDVPAPPGCQMVTTTITGLTSGSTYQFWLHTVLTDPLGGDPTVVMVGRSPVVDVP